MVCTVKSSVFSARKLIYANVLGIIIVTQCCNLEFHFVMKSLALAEGLQSRKKELKILQNNTVNEDRQVSQSATITQERVLKRYC